MNAEVFVKLFTKEIDSLTEIYFNSSKDSQVARMISELELDYDQFNSLRL